MNKPLTTAAPQARLETIAQRLMALPAEQQQRFVEQLDERGITLDRLPLTAAGARRGSLSSAQRRLWFLWCLEPSSTAYHIPAVVRLEGVVNVPRLRQALQQVCQRHQVLISTYDDAQHEPLQVVGDAVALSLDCVDLRSDTSGTLSELIEREAAAHLRQPFDLRREPPLRVRLVQLADEQSVLLLCVHHIASDGQSMGLLVSELGKAYALGQPDVAPTLPQYLDYAARQQVWRLSADYRHQLEGWRERLQGAAVLELQQDRVRPAQPTQRGAQHLLRLPAEQVRRLGQIAQQANVSLFMLLLASFALVLRRHSGQNDLSIGVPVSQRRLAGSESLIGLLVNTCVVRLQPADEQPFSTLLTHTRDAVLDMQASQDVPFEAVVEALGTAHDLERNPLFQVLFNHVRHAALPSQGPDGLRMSVLSRPAESAQVDLALNTNEQPDGSLHASFVYATDLFDATTIARLAGHYQRLLETLCDTADRPLHEYVLLSPAERSDLLVTRNATARQWPANDLLGLIAGQLESDPQAIAVVAGNEQLSRAGLAERSDRLAAWLRGRGVGIDSRVGIAAERSVELVVGLLGILKAGAAYVPLDSDYPAQRLQWMLEDSGMQLLLTQQRLLDRLPASAVPSFCLDRDWAQVQACAPLPTVDVPPLAAAYCIYTSGSTGRPKGVINSHEGLYNRLLWMQDAYGLTELDRVLQKTPISFDVSVWEFFWPLLTGARLVMAPPGAHRDPRQLRACIVEQGVTTLHFVPSMLQAFVGSGELAHCPSLTRILCSGEALPADLQQRTRAEHPAALYNLYGPTEAAIDVTAWTCGDWPRPCTPIGRPIANTQIHVLDEQLQPVPLGVAGELYIGGINLARGYLNRPGLTAERFVADPFGSGGRLYRSGDRARWTAEGEIEYLGRLDHQVKLRGQRLELGEIEARLRDYPGITAAAVILRDGPAGQQLIGYVCGPAAQEEDALRAHLAQTLPEALLPARLLALEHLPLTPNGKLDRNALPQVELTQQQYVAPRNDIERALADLWEQVLGAGQVGIEDNFFALGGDSINALQVVSRAAAQGLQLELRELFLHPRIDRLASRVSQLHTQVPTSAPLQPVPADLRARLPAELGELEDHYRLSPMQQGMLFHTQDDEGTLYINQLTVGVNGLDVTRFEAAWNATLAHHSVLRSAFLWDSGKDALQLVARQVRLPLSELDWRGRDTSVELLDDLARAERERGFDLLAAPLMRLLLVRLTDNRHHLIWTYHHVLMDGWSSSLLLGEVLRRYADPEHPQPAAGRFHDYIQWLESRDAALTEGYWRTRLQALGSPTQLAASLIPPRDGSRGHHAIYTRLDAPATAALRSFCREQSITLNTLVQGAWLILLQRYTGQRCPVFGATVSGRPAQLPGIEQMLGLFINTVPVLHPVADSQPVGDWLRALQAANLEGQAHEHASLPQIQRWARQGGQALFDSIIVFENQPVDQTLKAWNDADLQFDDIADVGLTNFAMDLMVSLTDCLHIEYMFLRESFTQQAVERLRDHLEYLLQSLAQQPECAVGNLGLSAALACQPTPTTATPWRSVMSRISENAQCQPQAAALIGEQGQLTFAELERQANQLAHLMIAHGVAAETRVGVALPRGPQTVVALLAVLKAGGAYVPLDASYPTERLAFLLEDAALTLLVTDSELSVSLPVPAQLPCLELDRLDLAMQPDSAPAVAVHPGQLAYLIYTSGSTGRPKGVAVTHGPLAMHCQAIGQRYGMSPADRELIFMSFSFDGAQERWITALSHGAGVVIRGEELWTPQQTLEAMREHRVTVAAFAPVYLQQLSAEAAHSGHVPSMRIYCFGGDAVPEAAYRQAWECLKPQAIINGYGPTETVITPLLWRAAIDDACGAAYAPIGSLVGARTGWVLDEDLNPLPPGLAGELYLGGEGLARGYHQRPGTSAERFVADPFGPPGARLYRTGDLVRQRDDGVFDYLGRIDHQVKIRGFRVELGEIEARLRQRPGVREAVVLAVETPHGRQLVAYVEGGEEGSGQLREQLHNQLPDYMVPAKIISLARLPVNANGKIDRRALPEPVWESSGRVEPRNDNERLLATLWAQVLGVEAVGIRDNFFELGGDSILCLQVMGRLRSLPSLGVEIKLRDLMRYQTIEGVLEHAMAAQTVAPSDSQALPGEFPLLPIQAWFFEQPMANRSHYNQAVLLDVREALDPLALESALQALVLQHASLRLRYRESAPGQWTQSYRETAELEAQWRSEPLLWQADIDTVEQVTVQAEAAQRSLDIQHGQLVRGQYLCLGQERRWLLLCIHHLAMDGVSWRILLEDLQAAYAHALDPAAEAPLPTGSPYRAWVERLGALALDPAWSTAQLAYWQGGDGPQVYVEPPRDNPRGRQQVAQQAAAMLVLDKAATARLLKQLPADLGVRIDDLLLAGLARSLCRWSQGDAVRVMLEGHGREDLFDELDLSRTLGWFTSLYPMGLRAPVGETFAVTARRIAEGFAALPDKGLGYGALRYLGSEQARAALAAHTARVTFNYMGQFDQSFADDGLFKPAREHMGALQGADTPLANWLEIVGQVYDGQLSLRCVYSQKVWRAETVQRFMDDYRNELLLATGVCDVAQP
jgi:amino acid adenylation domain-containing protein/non-ribosomal peptide synthase protein (TIGR01720 family)